VIQSQSSTLLSRPLLEGRIEMMAHQISAALRARDGMGGRALLADEVGLGKTIEACIIYEEYALMGLARRVLVLTPPALVSQWHEELRTKFSEDFVIASRLSRDFKGFDRHDRVIASMDTAKRPSVRERICSVDWDLLIVDEAHRLKNARTQNYRLVRAISSKYLLMLTATPIQNNLTELYNLVNLVRPGLLGSRFEFQSRFSADAKGRKVTNRSTLQKILSEVMVRTTRKETGLSFTRRFSNTIRLSPTDGEYRLYNAVTDYVRSRYDSLPEGKRARSAPDIFLLITLQRQLASSTPAIARALALRLAKAGPGKGSELEDLLRLAEGIEEDVKLTAMRELARTASSKMLIFTTFLRTQEYIKESLERLGMEVACYNGTMDEAEREQSLKAFRGGAQALVSTEAGSEGINLQFCNIVVNYDLPWNPLRVEQRIGRVHRIGQGEDVYIVSLTVKDTIEDHILELLYEKIQLFQLTIGDLELILGDEVGKIEPRIFRSFMENDKRGAKRAIEELGSTLQRRKERAESAKRRNEAIFDSMRLSPLRGDDAG
jgi:SNF2 family DNA or RNA helicase